TSAAAAGRARPPAASPPSNESESRRRGLGASAFTSGGSMYRRFRHALLVLTALAGAVLVAMTPQAAQAATATIVPGTAWTDTAGNRLQAHGVGIFLVGSTYYMVGEDKTAGSTFTAVACYSSTDLVHWTRQADALSRQGSGDLAAGRIVERPKVLYNSTTHKYVLWVHIDN